MIIIGFGHKKRVGKDTAVRFAMSFTRQYFPHLQSSILSFGNQLKDISYQMYKWGGLEEAIYYENNPLKIEEQLPPIGKSPRQIWDQVGLMGRNICPKTWIQMAISNLVVEADVLFCKDVRFMTEIELIRSFHGYAFRIDRETPVGGAVDTALSEFNDWDGLIENNGSLKEFNKKICSLVARCLNHDSSIDKKVCPFCYARGSAILQDSRIHCERCGKDHAS